MESLSEFIYADNATLKTIDLSFCNISSQGLLSLCHGLTTGGGEGIAPVAGTGADGEYDQDGRGQAARAGVVVGSGFEAQ